jgi:prevent-host-death family protein
VAVDKTYNVHEAKTHLSELLERAQAGEDIVIAKANRPIARIVPIRPPLKKRILGLGASGGYWMAKDFDEPLPDKFWLGGPDDLVNQTLDRLASKSLRVTGKRRAASRTRRSRR